MPITLSTPLSLYSIPVIWLTAFYPQNVKFNLLQNTIGYNNLWPRGNTERLANDPTIPRDIAERARKLEGAHLNGNEIFPVWAAAVLAGNMAGLPQKTLNIVSIAFIGMRILYNTLYINQKTSATSWVRTATFFSGLGLPMYLLIKAGNVLRNRA